MCKLKPLLSRWLDEADSATGGMPTIGGDKLNQQVKFSKKSLTNRILVSRKKAKKEDLNRVVDEKRARNGIRQAAETFCRGNYKCSRIPSA